MRYRCYCGSEIDLIASKRNKFSTRVPLYCTLACLTQHIESFVPHDLIPAGTKSILSQATNDIWDPITKLWYRSKYEVYVARYLKSLSYKVEYETRSLHFGTATYTPDFYLPDRSLFIEVKGLWSGSSKKKFHAAVDAGYHIILVPWYMEPRFRSKFGGNL